MTPAARIAARVRELRKARGYSLDVAAERYGMARSNVCRLERGTKIPTLPTLIEVARALDVRLTEIVGVLDDA